jgi:hypothetical protein
MKKVLAVLVVLLVAGTMLTGCSVKSLTEGDVNFAGPMVENMLLAENAKSYDMWAKDMDEAMLKAISKDKFEQAIVTPIHGKVGDYVAGSKKFLAAAQVKGNIVVQYTARFTNEDQVKLTISFADMGGQKKIVGEYFDSPKLRGK